MTKNKAVFVTLCFNLVFAEDKEYMIESTHRCYSLARVYFWLFVSRIAGNVFHWRVIHRCSNLLVSGSHWSRQVDVSKQVKCRFWMSVFDMAPRVYLCCFQRKIHHNPFFESHPQRHMHTHNHPMLEKKSPPSL